ncbi:MAG TPA: NHL repeat-containing protein [Phycisphaerae bacterium]|nr:NHL repeat-containing protein [Phycisphaerae bacterium]HNU46344.1 NHL repeat-containing protein [Phycisphaerae bacterium]
MIRYSIPRGLARLLTLACVPLLCLSVPAQADLELWASGQISAHFDGYTGEYLGDLFAPAHTYGLAFGPDGNVYVAWAERVLRYDPELLELIDVFVALGGGPNVGMCGLVFGPDENLYVCGATSDNVVRYDGNTGQYIDVFASEALDGAYGLRFSANGDLYVSSFLTDSVLRYDGQTGQLVDTLTAPGSLEAPSDLLFGPDGLLYVSSYLTGSVVRFDPVTGDFVGTFVQPGSGGLNWPVGLAFGPDGNLYVADERRTQNEILRYDGVTGAYLGVFASGGDHPTFLAFVPEPGSLLLLAGGVLLLGRKRRA